MEKCQVARQSSFKQFSFRLWIFLRVYLGAFVNLCKGSWFCWKQWCWQCYFFLGGVSWNCATQWPCATFGTGVSHATAPVFIPETLIFSSKFGELWSNSAIHFGGLVLGNCYNTHTLYINIRFMKSHVDLEIHLLISDRTHMLYLCNTHFTFMCTFWQGVTFKQLI